MINSKWQGKKMFMTGRKKNHSQLLIYSSLIMQFSEVTTWGQTSQEDTGVVQTLQHLFHTGVPLKSFIPNFTSQENP